MAIDSTRQIHATSRAFAQFPAMNWQAILAHARRLPGVEFAGLFGSDRGDTWLEFDFRLYRFTVERDGSAHVAITVDSCDCDRHLRHIVERHFAALLAPQLAAG